MLGPMTSDPELRENDSNYEKSLTNGNYVEAELKNGWIQLPTNDFNDGNLNGTRDGDDSQTVFGVQIMKNIHFTSYHMSNLIHTKCQCQNLDRMMDMMHHMWINPEMVQDMHTMMLEDPSHMAMMSNQMMEPMLNAIMDDPILRDQMIDLMLEHQDFMNSIRHENPNLNTDF